MRLIYVWVLVVACIGGAHARADSWVVRFVPDRLPPMEEGKPAHVCVIVRNAANKTLDAVLSFRGTPDVYVYPAQRRVKLAGSKCEAFGLRVRVTRTVTQPFKLEALIHGRPTAALSVGEHFDLSTLEWRAKLDKDRNGVEIGWEQPGFDDSGWQTSYLPFLSNDLGITYLRAQVIVPESWKGKPLHLRLAAVDDNDITYFNGVEIGRTNGWDKPRHYLVPENAVRFGKQNVISIAVDNIYAGGGIYGSPNTFGPEPNVAESKPAPKLHPAGPIGKPIPFRWMHVEDGVLRYPDGKEVCLFGVNYYPQSWHQYVNMKKLTADMKAAIRRDLDDMKAMGVEVIRVHVFDTEITDRYGNLLKNDHLDLLDYAVSEAKKRGIYYMFTLITWWPSPVQNPDSFSARTPKEAMWFADEAIAAQQNYIRQLLTHRNPYTKLRYCEEPAVCAFEIMNEPAYWDYNDMMAENEDCDWQSTTQRAAPFKAEMRDKWIKWCDDHYCPPDPAVFPAFRYMMVGEYLLKMYNTIRSTGARQPIAAALFATTGIKDITQAIADSPCEAVTTGDYAGSWDRWAKGNNYLNYADNTSLDASLNKKARIIYEWDCIRTLDSYMYPAFARRHRSEGAQISANFQYDSFVTAPYNSDWAHHYLNLFFTPSKAVGFRIAREVFHRLPRGAACATPSDNQVFGNFAVSFAHNISLMSTPEIWANAEPVGHWNPLPVPKAPKRIIGVGNSPFVDYDGSGSYEITIGSRSAQLLIRPDVSYVRDPLASDAAVDKLAAELRDQPRTLTFKYPGVNLKNVKRMDTGQAVGVQSNTFEVRAGKYRLEW